MDVSPFRISKCHERQNKLPKCEQTGKQEHTVYLRHPAVDLSIDIPVVWKLLRESVPQKESDQNREKCHNE